MKRSILSFTLTFACSLCAVSAMAEEKEPAQEESEKGTEEESDGDESDGEKAEASAEGEASAEAAVQTDTPGDGKKFFIGARLAYSLPLGNLGGDATGETAKLNDVVSGVIPIGLDLGYMITPHVMLGAYGAYGIGLTADKLCQDEGASCSAHTLRFGAQGQYHFNPDGTNGWVGLGIGYEILSFSAEREGISLDTSLKGFEFATLQGGVDFKAANGVGFGPYASFSFGQYSSASVNDKSADYPEKSMHEWLSLGLRGAFRL